MNPSKWEENLKKDTLIYNQESRFPQLLVKIENLGF